MKEDTGKEIKRKTNKKIDMEKKKRKKNFKT